MKITRRQLRQLIAEGMRDLGEKTRTLLRSGDPLVELVGIPDVRRKKGFEYMGGEVYFRYRFDVYVSDPSMGGMRQIGSIPLGRLDFESREEAMEYYNSPQFERELSMIYQRFTSAGETTFPRF